MMFKNSITKKKVDALFIGYEHQENLGLRYIMAYLEMNGFTSVIIPFTAHNNVDVISAVKDYSPKLVGFSIIFQYTLNDFANLASEMRAAGIDTHFTVGGHFPSMCPEEVLETVPQMNSVVRFEGEFTTLELLQKINTPQTWSSIKGLAFRKNSEVIINPPRSLISDLDSMPLPTRTNYRSSPQGIRIASILASRGCFHDCSFCSIRQFYGSPPGPLRRSRSPNNVVREMRNLFERDKIQFFIFQDDDFAAKSNKQRRWIESFLNALENEKLVGKIVWRIACRVDDVDEELFKRCQQHGMIAVYLGVESGNSKGLLTLNKRVTVQENLSAINSLKKMGVPFEIGFMLFDPDSTIDSIAENIKFLREISSDGSCSIPFCKMLPYAGTPIEVRLKKEGRLKGTICNPDYDFLDPRLNMYAIFVSRVFHFRNYNDLGLVERLRAARAVQLLLKMFEPSSKNVEYGNEIQKIIAKTNVAALNTLEFALDFISERDLMCILNEWQTLDYIADIEKQSEYIIQQELDHCLQIYNPEMWNVYKDEYMNRKPDTMIETLVEDADYLTN